jgi:hypothetical protein
MPVSLPAEGARSRFILWVAHQAVWIYASAAVASILSDVFPVIVLRIIAFVTLTGVFLLLWTRRYHGLTLCPLCAIATPLNGPEKARDRAAILQWAHRMYSRRYSLIYALIIVTYLGLFYFLLKVGRLGPLSNLPLDLFFVTGFVEAYVMSVHRPLQPWCPQCHWDDGGDQEPSPDPVPPSGAVVAQ